MGSSSHPRPAPTTWPLVHQRTLLPIFPPPESTPLPGLPSPTRAPRFTKEYTLTTHVFPAAYLRHTEDAPIPPPAPANANKTARREAMAEVDRGLRRMRVSMAPRGTPHVMWNCVNRYLKRDLGGIGVRERGVTLFFAHANGFPKETWEPTLRYLLSSPAAPAIDEVWVWESVQHGDACMLNKGELSGVFDWADDARDILNFFFHYLPSSTSNSPLPSHLHRVSPEESRHRMANGFHGRTLVAVGHSFGGCTSALAAMEYPKLFSSLVMVDPIMVKPVKAHSNIIEGASHLAMAALSRRDMWSSREEAFQLLERNPFFKTWEREVLKLYVEHGTFASCDADGNTVIRLKMPGIQEAIIFSEAHTAFEVWQRLHSLDEGIEICWIVPGKEDAYEFGPEGSTQERVWLRPKNTSNVRIKKAGHLIPQEAPRELATEIDLFLQRRYVSLRANL